MVFFFQAEDGIRDLVRSRGLGDVYKRQPDFKAKKELKDAKEEATIWVGGLDRINKARGILRLSLIHI